MKKIFVFGVLLLSMVSCKMDFYSSDSMTSAQLAQNPSSAVYTTDGIYSLFKDKIAYKGQSGGESGNYYVRHYFQLTELRGDNVTVSGVTEDPFIFPYVYADIPKEKNIYYTWWIAYKIINAANSNIQAIVPGSSALSDHLLGENYFFRALLHFQMVSLFAKPYVCGRDNPGVVLRNSLDISTTTRATVGEVYDQVVADLIEAKKYLAIGESERVSGADKSYVTLDAARALLARVYLYMEDNQKCLDECNELLDHAPSAVTSGYDFADYPTHTYNHPETIWCIHMDTSDEWAGEHAEASIASMYVKDGNGWGEHYWREELIDNFRRYPEDKRFAAYFKMVGGSPAKNLSYEEMEAASGGKVIVTFPIKTKESNDYCSSAIIFDRTPNTDGSVDFTYDGKSYKAVPTTVNTYTEYWVDGADFSKLPVETGAGKKSRVYIRPNVTRADGVRFNSADYVRYYCTKFSYQDGLPMLTSPVFLRWGEVVLNRAEAYAKLNQDGKAFDDVNTIRHRAGVTADITASNYTTLGYDSVLDVVLDERRRELCYEGHRFFDVFRNRLSMDRRYAGYHAWEVIDYTDNRIALLLPEDEINASGIAQNVR